MTLSFLSQSVHVPLWFILALAGLRRVRQWRKGQSSSE